MSCINSKCCEKETQVNKDLKEYCESLVNGNQDCFLYVVDSSSSLYQVDPVSLVSTLIGPTGFTGITDIAWDGTSLFGIVNGLFLEINTSTGAATTIGSIGAGGTALEAGPAGVIYMMGGNNFYSINKVTGVATLIGAMGAGFFSSGDLAWDAATSTMYGSFTSNNLGRINITTGAASNIGPFGFSSIWGLDFCDSTLYAVRSNGDLLDVNTGTGAGTLIGNIGVGSIFGMTSVESGAAVPCEPAALPQLEPVFTLTYGDKPGDVLETKDVQCVCITACNPYTNVCLNDVRVLVTQVLDPDGKPVDPDRFLLKPSRLICFGDLAPCDAKDEGCGCGGGSCASREFVIVTRGADKGKYTIAFDYCYEIAWSQPNSVKFEIEVV